MVASLCMYIGVFIGARRDGVVLVVAIVDIEVFV